MAYNPGITDRSGEILAQGTAAAAQMRMQGYQNATNSLLKGFSDLSKKQQEEEVKRNETLAKFKSDPSLAAKLSEKGNEDLKAKFDKLNTPTDGFWAGLAGRGDKADSQLLSQFATGTQEATVRKYQADEEARRVQAAKILEADSKLREKASGLEATRAGEVSAEAKRLADTYTRNQELTSSLQSQFNPGAPSLVRVPTDFTGAFDPSSRVLPTGVPGSLMSQSSMMRENVNPPPTPAQSISGNPFVRSPNMVPMDMSAAGIPPPPDRNNGFLAGAQPSFTSPISPAYKTVTSGRGPRAGENSLLADLVRSGVSLTSDKVSDAITKQAEIDFNKAKMPEGTTGPFIDGDGNPQTFIVRNGETVEINSGLPLQSTVTDTGTGFASKRPTVFPRRGVGITNARATRDVPDAANDPYGAKVPRAGGRRVKRTSPMGFDYFVEETP